MRAPRTDRATEHLARVAAQAATLRALDRQRAQLRRQLDRMIVAAYRDDVPASHLADAARVSRDTVHAAVKPYTKRPRTSPREQEPTATKATPKTTTPKATKTAAPRSATKTNRTRKAP